MNYFESFVLALEPFVVKNRNFTTKDTKDHTKDTKAKHQNSHHLMTLFFQSLTQ
jgi:hypothetical protein